MDDIAATLRQFLATRILTDEDPDRFGDDEPLIDSGILDSFALVQLVGFLEARFGISLPAEDITAERFGCVRAIVQLVTERARTAPSTAAGTPGGPVGVADA